MNDAKRLLQFLSKNKQLVSPLLILTHNYPDPDSIASAFALHYLAKTYYGIESKIVYGGFISRIENRHMVNLLKIPLHKVKSSDFRKFAHIALVDTQPGFKNNSLPKDKRATIVIDQHPSITKPSADLVIVNTEREATCEIIAQALLLIKKDIPANLATVLVYGILTDTSNLTRVRNRTTFRIYLSLLSHCNIKTLVRIQNPPRSKEFFVVMKKAIQLANIHGSAIFCHLGFVTDPVYIAHTADFLLNYRGIRWSFATGRYKDRLCVSLRSSKTNVFAHRILRDVFANEAEAGGHGAIAGGNLYVGKKTTKDIWRRIEVNMTKKLIKRLRIKGKNEKFMDV